MDAGGDNGCAVGIGDWRQEDGRHTNGLLCKWLVIGNQYAGGKNARQQQHREDNGKNLWAWFFLADNIQMDGFHWFIFHLVHWCLLLRFELCAIKDVENDAILDMHQHLYFSVDDSEFSADWHLIGVIGKEGRAFVNPGFGRIAVWKLNNQDCTVEVQKQIVGWVLAAVSWVDNRICLGNTGKLKGGI